MTWNNNKWEQGAYYNKQINRMVSNGFTLQDAEDYAYDRKYWFYHPTIKARGKKC